MWWVKTPRTQWKHRRPSEDTSGLLHRKEPVKGVIGSRLLAGRRRLSRLYAFTNCEEEEFSSIFELWSGKLNRARGFDSTGLSICGRSSDSQEVPASRPFKVEKFGHRQTAPTAAENWPTKQSQLLPALYSIYYRMAAASPLSGWPTNSVASTELWKKERKSTASFKLGGLARPSAGVITGLEL